MFGKLCGAKARTNDHKPCRQPAMANGRCRFHGGKSTGAKTTKGIARQRRANLKHGAYSSGVRTSKANLRKLLATSDELLDQAAASNEDHL